MFDSATVCFYFVFHVGFLHLRRNGTDNRNLSLNLFRKLPFMEIMAPKYPKLDLALWACYDELIEEVER